MIFEYTGEVAESLFGSAHFPDNYLRGFFIDPVTSKLMMTKCETPFGDFSNLTWSNPTVAFERAKVTDCRLHYMPGEFLFSLSIIKEIPTLLYYSVEQEQFFDVMEVLGKILNFRSESLRSAIALYWDNPVSEHLYDKVIIRRKIGEFPDSTDDGVLVYEGRENSVKDGNLLMQTEYSYRAFPIDVNNEVNDDEDGQTLKDSPLDLVTALYLVHANSVILENIRVIEDTDDSEIGVLSQNSMTRINNSTISNKDIAIDSTFGSYVVSQNNIGTNNEIGLLAENGGRIAKIGNQPEAQTPELTEEGGIIT